MATLNFEGWEGLNNAIDVVAGLARLSAQEHVEAARRRINARFDEWEREREEDRLWRAPEDPWARVLADLNTDRAP